MSIERTGEFVELCGEIAIIAVLTLVVVLLLNRRMDRIDDADHWLSERIVGREIKEGTHDGILRKLFGPPNANDN